jgi:hypothetical protein
MTHPAAAPTSGPPGLNRSPAAVWVRYPVRPSYSVCFESDLLGYLPS